MRDSPVFILRESRELPSCISKLRVNDVFRRAGDSQWYKCTASPALIESAQEWHVDSAPHQLLLENK